ncbi:MAG TPA: hypothetical protein VF982_02555 [Anaerolineales bacterium]
MQMGGRGYPSRAPGCAAQDDVLSVDVGGGEYAFRRVVQAVLVSVD